MYAHAHAQERLSGASERIAFHRPDSGFCVLRVKVPGAPALVTVIGSAASVAPGESLNEEGIWHNDRQHGLQFKANDLRQVPPSTAEGIEWSLGSGMVKGIGPHFAKTWVRAFGDVVFEIIEPHPERLLFGTVSLDGTKPVLSEAEGIHANASRHSALSDGHAEALEAQLKAEVQELLALVEAADGAKVPDGMSLPEELKRREDRFVAIAAAKVKLEARAAERETREQAEYEAKLAARAAKATASGRKPGCKPPAPTTTVPRPNDQINLTDEESRIMPVAGGGFEQCDNAPALVDTESLFVIIPQVTQATSDKQPIVPMLDDSPPSPRRMPPAQATDGRHRLLQ